MAIMLMFKNNTQVKINLQLTGRFCLQQQLAEQSNQADACGSHQDLVSSACIQCKEHCHSNIVPSVLWHCWLAKGRISCWQKPPSYLQTAKFYFVG